jgi:hypothetical protein
MAGFACFALWVRRLLLEARDNWTNVDANQYGNSNPQEDPDRYLDADSNANPKANNHARTYPNSHPEANRDIQGIPPGHYKVLIVAHRYVSDRGAEAVRHGRGADCRIAARRNPAISPKVQGTATAQWPTQQTSKPVHCASRHHAGGASLWKGFPFG